MKKPIFIVILLGTICLFSSNYINNSFNYVGHIFTSSEIKFGSQDESVLNETNVGWIVSHGEDDNSTYSFTINDLKSFGAEFSLINTAIDSVLLSSYNIIVIEEGGTNWMGSELLALKTWIEDGGALYIIGDQPGYSQGNVSQYFNVYYNVSLVSDGLLTLTDPSHPLFEGVTSIDSFFSTASIDETLSTDSLKVLARSRDNQCLIASLLIENGRILWNVNSDGIINNPSISIADHHKLANNSWIWLATPAPYTPQGGNGDNSLIIIITVSSIAAIAILGTVIYIIRRRKSRNLEIIDNVVEDIQDKKTKD